MPVNINKAPKIWNNSNFSLRKIIEIKLLNIGIKFKNRHELFAPIILMALIHNKYEINAGPIPQYKTSNQPYCSFITNDWLIEDSKM